MNYTNFVQNKMLTGRTLFDLGFLKKKKNSGAWFLRTRISNFYQIRCSSKSIDSDGFSIESCRKKKNQNIWRRAKVQWVKTISLI